MEWTLRELRCFVTAADAGTLTEAAEQLHVSQAAVSRSIAALERTLGRRVLHRGRHGCEPTAFGEILLPRARRILTNVEQFDTLAREQHGQLAVGYAWAALGKHTAPLLRGWAKDHPATDLRLVQHGSSTSGLAEGRCDAAIMRTPPDDPRFASAVVGLERRLAAFSSDDHLWSRRRSLKMRDFEGRTVLADLRSGTTSRALWDGGPAPQRFIETTNIEDWLNQLVVGAAVGVSSEASAAQHSRPGVSFVPIVDAPRIPVRIVWWRHDPPDDIATLLETVTKLYAAG